MNKNIFKNGPWKDSEKLTKKKTIVEIEEMPVVAID